MKISLTIEKFLDVEKFPRLEKLLDCGKIARLWKSVLILKKFVDCGNLLGSGKFSQLWKSSLTVQEFLDRGKLTLLTAEKIMPPIILKVNANVATISAYILNL